MSDDEKFEAYSRYYFDKYLDHADRRAAMQEYLDDTYGAAQLIDTARSYDDIDSDWVECLEELEEDLELNGTLSKDGWDYLVDFFEYDNEVCDMDDVFEYWRDVHIDEYSEEIYEMIDDEEDYERDPYSYFGLRESNFH